MTMWNRYRFFVPGNDPRPMTFPPPGPYWVSGSNENGSTVVAYLPSGVILRSGNLWPDAEQITVVESVAHIEYTSRFRKPAWFDDGTSETPLEVATKDPTLDALDAKKWRYFAKNGLGYNFCDPSSGFAWVPIETVVREVNMAIERQDNATAA